MLYFQLLKFASLGFAFFSCFSVKLFDKEFTSIGVPHHSDVCIGCSLRLPIQFSKGFIRTDEVLLKSVILADNYLGVMWFGGIESWSK